MRKLGLKTILGFFAVLLINTALLSAFYQRTWAPQEDGYFAHVAERLFQGEKLYRDVESRHAGYVHFVNAAAMSVLGPTLATPRIPVALLSLTQSIILFFMFVPHSLSLAILAALISVILGYLQCLTPSTHWYCLFLLTLMITCLYKLPSKNPFKIPLLGFLLGLIILFRQLTGFFAGAGLLIYLLTETSERQETGSPFLARLLLLLTSGLLIMNFMDTYEINGFLLFGLWPCFLMLWALFHTRTSNSTAFSLCLKLGLGLLIAFLPLFFYLAAHHAFFLWMDDTLIRSSHMLKNTPYQTWSSYALYQISGAKQILHPQGLRLFLNGLYWFSLPLLAFFNGLLVFLALLKRKTLSHQDAFPLLAVFYSIVSYTLQIPIYLYYSVSISLISLLWISKTHFKKLTLSVYFLSILLLSVGLYYHAGQPPQRGLTGIITGERQRLIEKKALPKLGLKIQKADGETYEELIDYIKMRVGMKDSIFVFPNNPEIYFLTDRKNPYRFTLTPTALQSQADVEQVLTLLHSHPPKMILHNPGDKYNTALGFLVLEDIKKNYTLQKMISPFEIYEENA